MRSFAFVLVLALIACGTPPAHSGRVDLRLENHTDAALSFKAEACGLSRTIELEPGESWEGWVIVNPEQKARPRFVVRRVVK